MGPIEAANLFADLSELCEKRENGEEGCPWCTMKRQTSTAVTPFRLRLTRTPTAVGH